MADQFGTCNVELGPVLIDVPRSIGYYGGVAAAVALGLVDPPLAVFIAAVPFFKMLTHWSLPMPVRFVGETLEGAGKPVGGDDDGYVRLQDERRDRARARAIARQVYREEVRGDPAAEGAVTLRPV